jgi:hypothetical protein
VFEDYIEELECKSCGKPIPQKPVNQGATASVANIATLSPKISALTISQLPFGDFLVIKNDKLTVSETYLKDNGSHFYELMKKCLEIFPDDTKLQPHQSPSPENIHMLINYCTMNSELNIKKIMMKSKRNMSDNSDESSDESEEEEYETGEDSDEEEEELSEDEYEESDEEAGDSDSGEEESDEDEDSDEESDEDDSCEEEDDEREQFGHMSGIVRSNTQESRLLFQIYLARIFAHNVNVAFKDMMALKAQQELLQECENGDTQRKKNGKQVKQQPTKKKNKKQQQQQQQQKKKKDAAKPQKVVSNTPPKSEEQKPELPSLETLKEASAVVLSSEEAMSDEWNVVQHNKPKAVKQSHPTPRSSNPSSRPPSPTNVITSTSNLTTSSNTRSQQKKHRNSIIEEDSSNRSPRCDTSVKSIILDDDIRIDEDEDISIDITMDEVFYDTRDHTTPTKHYPIGYELNRMHHEVVEMEQPLDIGYVSSPFNLRSIPFFRIY